MPLYHLFVVVLCGFYISAEETKNSGRGVIENKERIKKNKNINTSLRHAAAVDKVKIVLGVGAKGVMIFIKLRKKGLELTVQNEDGETPLGLVPAIRKQGI